MGYLYRACVIRGGMGFKSNGDRPHEGPETQTNYERSDKEVSHWQSQMEQCGGLPIRTRAEIGVPELSCGRKELELLLKAHLRVPWLGLGAGASFAECLNLTLTFQSSGPGPPLTSHVPSQTGWLP